MFVAEAPSIADLFSRLGERKTAGALASQAEVERDRYLHWDKLRHLDPPEGLTTEEWWLKIKAARGAATRRLPLVDPAGNRFGYTLPDLVLRHLHHIDQRCAGEVAMEEVVTSDRQARGRYLVNSLMEEAIRSSQLEGATTSRAVAKELLRSGRAPKDRSEQMIVNNYRALQFMREGMGNSLSVESILELHRILTEGTLDDPAASGRMQQPGEERVAVYDRDDGKPVHVPPPADQLPERMALLCDFANEGDDGDPFIHPVVRAILLHFWLAYDHPFEDGNGRTARALFYWSMLRQGYWLAEFLSISTVLREAPARYARAFLHTETDDNDLTYFLLHQLEVIGRAIESFEAYLHRKVDEVRTVEALLAKESMLNHRQRALLGQALRDPSSEFTMAAHRATHNVVYQTARTDLLGLARLALLNLEQRGREFVFTVPVDLSRRLRKNTNY